MCLLKILQNGTLFVYVNLFSDSPNITSWLNWRNIHLLVSYCVHQLAGAAGSTAAAGDKETEERTRAALVAWLGSDYIDRNELESRLAALAQSVSEDLNSKIDNAAMLAAAAAGLHCLDSELI